MYHHMNKDYTFFQNKILHQPMVKLRLNPGSATEHYFNICIFCFIVETLCTMLS